MFTFDDVLAATNDGRAEVLSVNNDVSTINAQAALLDERELAKQYTAAQIQAMRDDPARQREAVEAAIGRAALDTTGGKVRVMVAACRPGIGWA